MLAKRAQLHAVSFAPLPAFSPDFRYIRTSLQECATESSVPEEPQSPGMSCQWRCCVFLDAIAARALCCCTMHCIASVDCSVESETTTVHRASTCMESLISSHLQQKHTHSSFLPFFLASLPPSASCHSSSIIIIIIIIFLANTSDIDFGSE